MKKIIRYVLGALLIFLIVSCNEPKWDWEADPYVADHGYQSIYSAIHEKEIFCNQKEFDDFWCFPSKNIEELKFNIERLKRYVKKSKISKKKKKRLIKMISSIKI